MYLHIFCRHETTSLQLFMNSDPIAACGLWQHLAGCGCLWWPVAALRLWWLPPLERYPKLISQGFAGVLEWQMAIWDVHGKVKADDKGYADVAGNDEGWIDYRTCNALELKGARGLYL